jgi:hypothetical protein
MKTLNTFRVLLLVGATFLSLPSFSRTSSKANASNESEREKVEQTIIKVNDYWQIHNSYKTPSFWNWAAYHTGNMEAYKLFNNEIKTPAAKQKAKTWLDYSNAWADYNKWSGATEKNPSKWLYKQYGEDQQHVLFGDWQICFQTFMDLYNIAPAKKKIARAKEVMSYEADSKANDYWWWADALYMVMPTLTKMYKLTGDVKYLDKIYDNLQYSDSIMLDKETGLYFRDGRYVYPKHKANNGGKDFWARGDGWVLAGLAKVLQDMPKSYQHYDFFVKKYQRLAHAVAACQQPEGYWTRSMLDKEMAPGPETSGTAFFTYGLLWGINNGLLSETDYLPTVSKAWTYLSHTALQAEGSVGYVQPIGDRAIPGQTINKSSQADFGVGSFLLAACEYYRWLAAKENPSKTVSIIISNPSTETRTQVVEVDAADVRKLLGIDENDPFVIKNAAGQELDTQLTYDGKLLIDASVLAGSTWTVYASKGYPKTMDPQVQGALYKIRKDDIAWENDRCAYRVYGPALQRTGEKSFGIDVWVKDAPELILDHRYYKDMQSNIDAAPLEKDGRKEEARFVHNNGSFHLDHDGSWGMDGYGVGPTLGCGTPAYIKDGKLVLPYCYTDYDILDNGPLRFTVCLEYGKNADGVVEHRVISLDKGSHFNKIKVWYDDMNTSTTFCSGVVLNGKGTEATGNNWVAYADPTDRPDVHGSEIYVAALFPNNNVKTGKTPDSRNLVGVIDGYKGEPITYYAGAGWSRYDVSNFTVWKQLVAEFLNEIKQPLTISIR